MIKYYYKNKLSNQNVTTKPNIVWAADCTSLDLGILLKINLFLCLDISTNLIIAYKFSKKIIKSRQVTDALNLNKKFTIKPKRKLIIYTDRGTQFSSQAYNKFVENYKDIFEPSMSRHRTSNDNLVNIALHCSNY